MSRGFLGVSVVKNLPVSTGDMGSISESGRSSGEGNGNLLQYSSLENSMDREAWWATVHGAAKSQIQLNIQRLHFRKEKLSWLGGFEKSC